eukprot:1202161-Pleurochrysis_carterae.AAC.1
MVKCMPPVFNTPPCDDAGERRSIRLWHEAWSDSCAQTRARQRKQTASETWLSGVQNRVCRVRT